MKLHEWGWGWDGQLWRIRLDLGGIEIKGAYITCDVVHDIRFQRHLHVNSPNDVTELPFVDLQHPLNIRWVTCAHCVSTVRSDG